jgi:hypothetical protein
MNSSHFIYLYTSCHSMLVEHWSLFGVCLQYNKMLCARNHMDSWIHNLLLCSMLSLFALDECEDFVVIPIVVVLSSCISAIGSIFWIFRFWTIELWLIAPISDEFMLCYCDCGRDTFKSAMQNFYARDCAKILRCCAKLFWKNTQ